MKRIFSVFVLCTLSLCTLLAANVPVVIVAGQSNTDGRVPSADMPSYLSAYASAGMTNVVWSYGNSSGWSLTGGAGVFAPFYPMCESSNDRNRWAYDAVVYYNLSQHLTSTLYVVKESAGGTSIAPASTSSGNRHWSVDAAFLDTAGVVGVSNSVSGGSGKALAPALVYNIRRCIASIEAAGNTPDIRCILWHQGESDRTPTASADAYHDNLQALMQYLRDSIVAITGNNAYASVPIIIGTVSKKSALYSSTIEKAQYRLANEMTHFYVIDMQDGTMLDDLKHFDAASAELFGQRMYNKICALDLFSAYGLQTTDALPGVEDAQQGVDFGEEVVVSDSTKWVFTDFAHNDTIAKNLLCRDGLYLRGYTGNHAIIAKNVNSTIAAYVQASPIFVSDISTAGMAVTSANDRSIAMNIAYPGKITIVARSNNNTATEAVQARKMVVWFNGDTVASKTLSEIAAEGNSYKTTFEFETQTAGVVYLTCENAFYVFSVEYVPKPEQEGGDDIIGGEEQEEQEEQPKQGKRLHMCGDSMMSTYLEDDASNPEQFRGWGQLMEEYLDSLPVTNWAHTGTSAKGFYTSPRKIFDETVSTKSYWQCVLDSLHAGDYVILCWGHNDQKSSAGYRTWRASEYGTTAEYDVYMGLMIAEAQAKGAQVIIASSICRNLWSGDHLTTLAQIDGSEEQGYTTEGTNHDFDFPYGAQYMATQHGLPFIDLTKETKKLLEGYGSKSAASIFYGNGGTTHTSELGARAVVQIADSILLGLGIMTEYIKADSIHIPWYTPGEDTEVRVADSTVWVLSGLETGSQIDSLYAHNGLYFRGATATNHWFTISNTNNAYKAQTFSNGTAVNCSQLAATAGYTPSLSGVSAGAAVTSTDDRVVAMNSACPGTFYVLLYTTNTTAGRYVALSFNGELVDSTLTTNVQNRVVELKYHAESKGTFAAWSTAGWSFMAAQFIPDADNTEDDWHEPGTEPEEETGDGKIYYVSTMGSDSNPGTIGSPFATLNKAYTVVTPGDTVYVRGGTYVIDPSQIMTPSATTGTGYYTYVFDLAKAGNATDGHIVFAGYPGERPVFDFSQILPETRIVGFYLHADYIHLKNFEVTGITATLHGHYQCECIAARNGSYCIVENIAMHDNMAIGYYATKGHNNLVLNCDAYNNYDDYSAFKNDSLYNVYKTTGTVPSGSTSETLGGNCDGFGFHANRDTDTCNVFRGCRAWWNSDDGFDCINSKTAVVWDSCWAFYNGYKPGSNSKAGDGNGFKAGGYGMSTPASNLPGEGYDIPQNVISNCIAFYNKSNGFYANHHLGGNRWENNTAMWNWKNFDFTNRKEANTTGTAQDVKGYGHIICRNVSFAPQDGSNKDARHFSTIDSTQCTLEDNVIASSTDFLDCTRLSYTQLAKIALCNPRQEDGSLPYTPFLRAAKTSSLWTNHQGALFEYVEDTSAIEEVEEKEIVRYDPNLPVYTLLGQCVATPPCTGVYIQNGHKLFIYK